MRVSPQHVESFLYAMGFNETDLYKAGLDETWSNKTQNVTQYEIAGNSISSQTNNPLNTSGSLKTDREIAQEQDAQALEQARLAIGNASANTWDASASEDSSPSSPSSPSSSVQTVFNSPHAWESARARMAVQRFVTILEAASEQKQTVDTMMTLLLQETKVARKRLQARWIRTIVGLIFLLWLVVATRGHFIGNFWWLLNLGGGAWAIDRTAHRRRETASALGQAGDPRAVGVLAVVVRDGDKSVRHAAAGALLTLLPRVRANHGTFITPDQMNALLELGFRSASAMQIAVLKALEQVGDQRAIPVVENLAVSPQREVREQAQLCLPFLIERARRSEQSATLLRGAASPSLEGSGRELLRAAVETPDQTPADQLLRPTLLAP